MKKRSLSLLLVLVMVLSMFPSPVYAGTAGDGTAENPYQVGDVVTNDGTAEPEGYTVDDTYWARTEDVPAAENLVCQTEAHDHVTAGCEAAYETVECLLEGHPTEGELTSVNHENGITCTYDAENAKWLTSAANGYSCGIEAHTHTVEAGCIAVVPAYTVWTLTQSEQTPPPANNALLAQALEPRAGSQDTSLPIHFFLASPGNITNPNGSYVNYYGPAEWNLRTWEASYPVADIRTSGNWNQIFTQQGIRNVYEESIVTNYVASWPRGDAAAFKDFGSVTINGRTYYDTDYEIKWVSIMCRNNDLGNVGLSCNQRNVEGEHIHIDGLLVEKIQPGEMEVYKTIPEALNVNTTFRFTLQKMLQANLTSPPTSANAVDTSFAPMTLTASIPAGQTQAQIVGGSEISFGYYKLTEVDSADWQNAGIALTDSRGNTQVIDADTLYICIAPNGTVQYSTTASGPYTVMNRVAVQNERQDVTVTYQWRVYNLDGTYSEDLPAGLGAHSLPSPVTGVKVGSEFVYNTGFVQGTSYHDYENGLLYTFHGWDTYSNSSVFNTDPTETGYTKLDDGDAVASNNKKIPITANTWINGYWTVSELPPADAYLLVHKDVVVSNGDAQYVNNYLQNVGKMFISIDPGIDKDGDGKSQIDVDFPGAVAEGGYKINVYQYAVPFAFAELQAEVPGYARTVDITVSGSNLTLTAENGDRAEVTITEEYDPEQAPYNLGTVTYTNTYTKNVGNPVTEYPALMIVKRATDTGLLQANAVFTLYSDSACTDPITTFTTNAEGVADINFATLLANVSGTYTAYLKETAAPSGYLLDDAVYTLTLTPSVKEELRDNVFVNVTTYTLSISVPAGSIAEPVQNAAEELQYSLNIYNDPILGTLTVEKTAVGLDKADKELLEATITVHGPIVRNAQGEITGLGDSYTLTLNGDNEWAMVQDQLPIGEYLIHENLASVHGYTWDMNNVDYGTLKTEVYNNITSGVFEITAGHTDIELTITNTYKKWESAGFDIYKIDPTGMQLSGAAFQLYSDEACTTKVTDTSITTSAVTGANGYAWFSGFTVPADDADGIVTYYLRETKAPAGHYLSNTVYRVDIKAVTDDAGTTTFEPKISVKRNGQWVESPDFSKTSDSLTIVNTPVKGQITIIKNMVGAPANLNSVTLYVSGPDGYAETVTLTREGGWKITLADLVLGEYTIIEEDAEAPGYDLVTTYLVDGTGVTDKAIIVLKEENPGYTESDTVFAGTAEVTNTYTRREETIENPTSLTVRKVDEDGTTPLKGAVFTLVRERDGQTVSYTTNEHGEVIFSFLSGVIDDGEVVEGTYTLTETTPPDGYVATDIQWKITVKEDDGKVTIKLNEDKNIFENIWDWIVGGVTGETAADWTWEGNILKVQNIKKTGTLTITKTVDDPQEYYTEAEYAFTLDCSDDAFDKTFILKAGETYTVENIPWGTTYTLNEDTSGAAFTSTINDSGDGLVWAEVTHITVTNTYAYTSHNEPLALVKVDADDNSKVIPGAGFTLYADEALETKLGSEVFSDENGTLMLPIEAAGIYFLAETTTPAGYHSNPNIYTVTAEQEYVVKNAGTGDAVTEIQMHIRIEGLTGTTDNQIDYTYNIENTPIKKVVVNAEKIWDDDGYQARPANVEVVLLRDNEVFETVVLDESNEWRYTWEDLTDEYDWLVDEKSVPEGYTKNVTSDGYDFTITNTRNFEYIDVSVNKVWYGADVTHPDSVEVTLYQDGTVYDTVTLSAANNWSYTWEKLADMFEWTVDEPSVPSGYNKTVRQNGYSFTITNTHEDNPKTGDTTDLLGLGLMGMVGIVGFCVTIFAIFVPHKKKENEQ